MNKVSLLIIDDQPEILKALERILRLQYRVLLAADGPTALKILQKEPVAVIICDQRMPQMDGVHVLQRAQEIQPHAIRILITGYADIQATIDAVNQAHIFQYIAKPFEPDELLAIINQAVEKYLQTQEELRHKERLKKEREQLLKEKQLLMQQLPRQLDVGNFIGNSPAVQRVLKLVQKVVNTPTTVLLLGETGTGKELLARIIHYNSARKKRLFVTQNCGAIPDTLLQSELFGHVKGAFTGAISDKKGLFELADQGTIFLDEIADTSPAFQVGLLRVLQEGEIKPLGANNTRKINVRVIAATNRDLEQEVKQGRFREDLYYRLAVFPITLPPLRERKEDIPDLVQYFLKKYSARIGKNIPYVAPEVIQILQQHDFPGNIRELENEVERLVTLADENHPITADLLSPRFSYHPAQGFTPTGNLSLRAAVEQLERTLITRALQETRGNILQAAQKLSISRVGLHKMINRLQIPIQQFKNQK